MSWAEVKKINSDMSKPLDELIKGEKRFIANDTPMVEFINTPVEIRVDSDEGDEPLILGIFNPEVDGVIRIIFNFILYEAYSLNFSVYENGSPIYSYRHQDNTANAQEHIVDLEIKKGNTYSFKTILREIGYNKRNSANSLKICGQVTDYNYFTYQTFN